MQEEDDKSYHYVQVRFKDEMLRKIDEFRWKNRLPSRNEAIRQLIAYALSRNPKLPAD